MTTSNETGCLIVLEGGEGTGKTHQANQITKTLTHRGYSVTQTRDPGGGNNAGVIRNLLVDTNAPNWNAMTELLLFNAARVELLNQVVQPALERGDIVILDRFLDSTLAYQGAGRGHNTETIQRLHRLACSGIKPDLTILLDGPVENMLARAHSRLASQGSTETRFEDQDLAFHQRVAECFRNIARNDETGRHIIVDANVHADKVTETILQGIKSRLRL